MTREEVFEKAKEYVCHSRENDYGSPENNFILIANLWSAYLDSDVTAQDVAMMMAMLKIARIKTGTGKADSYIDLAGYAACAGEIGGSND